MLVLARKVGQCVRVGDVQVIVREVRGRKVRLGFVGPREVKIERDETVPPEEPAPPEPAAV